METLIHAFISSRLDYCKSLLFGVPECHLHKLQRVQNAAACLIFQGSRFCHITPLFKSLHWLSVKYCIVFKIILITFKAIHGLAPAYISELISVRDTGRYDLRSNDGLLLAPCRGKTLTTLGDWSFHAAAPKLWNDLLCSIRNNQSLNKFKKPLRLFYLPKLFNSLYLISYFYIFLVIIFIYLFNFFTIFFYFFIFIFYFIYFSCFILVV